MSVDRLSNIERTTADYDAVMRSVETLDRLVCEFCVALGEPIPVDAIARAKQLRGAVAKARAEQREATIRHAAEFLETLGRGDLARALTRTLGGRT